MGPACYRASIDNTDITRSVLAVGRESKFPLDIECLALPSLKNVGNNTLFNYLYHVPIISNFSTFSTEVLKILVEERCTYHQERHIQNYPVSIFTVSDVVKAHIQVTFNADKGVVGKLAYKSCIPFCYC